MSRINTNVQSQLAQRVLGQNNKALNTSLERLSTGLRINRGADDPAGLIASEKLRSETASIQAAIGNAERADQVVNIAEGGLQEVNSLLLDVQSLVGQSANEAGLSQDEREANQLQIDSILQTIDRISESTSFQGTKLLNGTYDFQISGQSTKVDDFQINGAKLAHGENRKVDVLVTNSAQHAGLYLSTAGSTLAFSGQEFSFEVAGAKGSRQFTFASGTATSSIADQINTFKSTTGVSAIASSTGLVFKSTQFGSDQFVSVDIADDGTNQAGGVFQLSGTDEAAVASGTTGTAYTAATNAVRDTGVDVGAVINGVQATSDGKTARINTDFLDLELELSDDGVQSLGTIDALTITGGGARFNLGPRVDIINQVSLGIGNVAARNLGTVSNGFLDQLGSSKSANVVDGDLAQAQNIVNESIDQVSKLRGRLGAFQKNTVQSTINSLGITLENTQAAESSIRDTDFAAETAKLTRNQILVSAATNTLGIANNQPQNVLQLLGG